MTLLVILYLISIPTTMFLFALDFKQDEWINGVTIGDLIVFFFLSLIPVGSLMAAVFITIFRVGRNLLEKVFGEDFLDKGVW